jgi:hypothetical protein
MNFSAVNFNPYEGTDKSPGAEDKSSQGLQDFSIDNAIAQCRSCGSNKVLVVSMTPGSVHHAAIRCGQCDRFLAWQPKPGSQERLRRQQTAIDQLLKSPQLSDWEREFLLSMWDKRSLSPKQLATIQKIETKLGAAQ